MKVQILSDIHLEFSRKNINFPDIIEPMEGCNILILAGDIGYITNKNWRNFMYYISDRWEYIVYVLGNHEYYSPTHDFYALQNMYKNYLSSFFDNIYLLEHESIKINDYVIAGCTLWSNPLTTDGLNDFNHIKVTYVNNIDKYCVDDMMSLAFIRSYNMKSIDWIKYQLSLNKNNKLILVTHFPTTKQNITHTTDHNMIHYYGNDLTFTTPVIAISGHTHSNVDTISNNVRYISNSSCNRMYKRTKDNKYFQL